jgi:uncharacterized membrane protein
MMGHSMEGMGVYMVLFTILLVALLVLAVTATTWLIRNMMGNSRVNRATSDGRPTTSGSG